MINHLPEQLLTNQEVIDFNQKGFHTIRCIKTPKKNHQLKMDFDPQTVDKAYGLKQNMTHNGPIVGSVLRIFNHFPFIKEKQLYYYVQCDKGKSLTAHDYHVLKFFLKFLRYLKVIKKYEYEISNHKQIAYILVDEKTYSGLFPDRQKDYLAQHHAIQSISDFNRRQILDWENAFRAYQLLLNTDFSHLTLRNYYGLPIVFFKYHNHLYGIIIVNIFDDHVVQDRQIINNFNFEMDTKIPLFIGFYMVNHSLKTKQIRELQALSYDIFNHDLQSFFDEFDFNAWQQKIAYKRYRQDHPVLGIFKNLL